MAIGVSPTLPVQTRSPSSGMRVVVAQDDGATVVGVAVVIDVGQADDPARVPALPT
jgi:predicted Zn-dependent peptidase